MLNTPATRRLAAYRERAENRVATIYRCHGNNAAQVVEYMNAGDWRANRYPARRGAHGGNWGDAPKHVSFTLTRERPYYCDKFPPGWRDHGSAHDVCRREGSRRIDHNGWYCDADQRETVQGYVLQIPAREGVPQYVPALKWSDRDGVTLYPLDRYEEILDAASAADGYAEAIAEQEREWDEAWQAGSLWSDLGEEIKSNNAQIKEYRASLRNLVDKTARKVMRGAINGLKAENERHDKKREELVSDNLYQADAFNEGAGRKVIKS